MDKSLKRELCCDNRDIVKPSDTDICAGNGSTRGSHLREYVRVCFIYVCGTTVTEGFLVEVTSEFHLKGPGLTGLRVCST